MITSPINTRTCRRTKPYAWRSGIIPSVVSVRPGRELDSWVADCSTLAMMFAWVTSAGRLCPVLVVPEYIVPFGKPQHLPQCPRFHSWGLSMQFDGDPRHPEALSPPILVAPCRQVSFGSLKLVYSFRSKTGDPNRVYPVERLCLRRFPEQLQQRGLYLEALCR
jgi:hypothetical protein